MRSILKFILIFVTAIWLSIPVNGQDILQRISQPDAVGGGLVFTHQDKLGGKTAVGAGIELFLKYNVSPRIFISAGTGIATASDKTLSTEFFKTTIFPTVEVKAGYKLVEGTKISPFIFAGLQAAGYKYSMNTPFGKFSSDRVYDGGVLVGGGLEYNYNDKLNFQISGDYRNFFTATTSPKPQFWIAKAGFNYSLHVGPKGTREEMEYPFDDESELALDELFKEEFEGKKKERTTEEDALALLFEPEETSNTASRFEESSISEFDEMNYPDTEVGQMMAKIHKLKNDMEQRVQELDNLKMQVQSNEKAIAEITGRVAGEYTSYEASPFGIVSPENFKNIYEKGLQNFYARKYVEAIKLFKELISTNPDHRLASNCQYWIGESYNAQGEYRKAIEAFNAVMRYRSSYKFDDALLMSGLCYLKLGDTVTARENFQELMSRYPESEYAPKAMRYLGRL